MIKEGGKAPDFSLPDAKGRMHSLADYAGKTVVLYFYPKDDTPGCTTEACGFRDTYASLAKAGIEVLGVSADDAASHERFAGRYSLPFPLLIDKGAKVARAYGSWGEKSLFGIRYQGMIRNTFIIRDGRIAKSFFKVSPKGHANEVLKASGAADTGTGH